MGTASLWVRTGPPKWKGTQLSGPLRAFTTWNPLFYMVDGVRFGMLGFSDADPRAGFAVIAVIGLVSLTSAFLLLRSGWKLRG